MMLLTFVSAVIGSLIGATIGYVMGYKTKQKMDVLSKKNPDINSQSCKDLPKMTKKQENSKPKNKSKRKKE